MTAAVAKKTNQPSVLVEYTSGLASQQGRAAAEAAEAKDMLAALFESDGKPAVISSQDEYEEVGSALKQANDKFKFLDEERKISVGPLNNEVKRVNDWYRPALDAFKSIREQAERMMSVWILACRREEQRLLREAEIEAKKVLATAPGAGVRGGEAMAPTQALVTKAAAAAPAKIEKVAHKPVWRWKVTTPALLAVGLTTAEHALIASFIKSVEGDNTVISLDLKAIATLVKAYTNAMTMKFTQVNETAVGDWVKEHGNKNVPAGVEVTEDVGFTVRK